MSQPSQVTLKAYQVGFGDCFLLTLHYDTEGTKRHILIDFGSTGLPKDFPKDQMLRVAEDIRKNCGEQGLDLLVATHRHKDHISGFSTQSKSSKGISTGEIIKDLDPKLLILPWTENPALKTDSPSAVLRDEFSLKTNSQKAFVEILQDMQTMSRTVIKEAERLSLKSTSLRNRHGFLKPLDEKTANHLTFMGENNLPNLSAVKNLNDMARKAETHYVHYGYPLNVEEQLPGVKITVLGPPTLDQYEAIARQRSSDKDEFWMLQAIHKNYWAMQATTNELIDSLNNNKTTADKIFPDAGCFRNYEPSETRWFTRRIRSVRAEQLTGLVRILDDALNNTSVILLFEIGDKKLLFPGDAQIENWEYALKHVPEANNNLTLLRGTTLYKVGHHGSRNATPKTLWDNFAKKIPNRVRSQSILTVISTLPGKHGTTASTAVPRSTLVKALKDGSRYSSTEEIKVGDQSLCLNIDV